MNEEECICAEWDGKGYSVCGVPCDVHWKSKNGETKEEDYAETQRKINEFIKKQLN